MTLTKNFAAATAAITLLCAAPAAADDLSQAEKLRRLDIMLMVTGLRCRAGGNDFQADYGRFTTNHIDELNAASNRLKADMTARYGAGGAARVLDRLSTVMANQYGNGHPWLGCAQLKQVAQGLAAARGTAPLVEAADQLLGTSGSAQFALVGR